MATNRKPVTPEQRSRDLQREFRSLQNEDGGPQRARELATLARAAHEDRQLNLAMQAADQSLEDDPDAPRLLVEAYHSTASGEAQLEELADLRDLARYLDRVDMRERAEEEFTQAAREWVQQGDDGERRYRLRTVQSLGGRELADTLRDELQER